jgi:hypothetical protein
MVEAVNRGVILPFFAFLRQGLISYFLSISFAVRSNHPYLVLSVLSLSHHPTFFFRNRWSPLVMILYLYLIPCCFAVALACPISGATEGLLPRLALGPVTNRMDTLYHSLGRLSIPAKTLCYQALRPCFFLSETSPFPPNFSTGYHRYMCFT